MSIRLNGVLDRLRGRRFTRHDLEAIRITFIQALSEVIRGEDESGSVVDSERQAGIHLIDRGSALVDEVYTQVTGVDCSTAPS